MHRERGRIDVGQSPDVVPGLFSILVLQVADEVVHNEAVHLAGGPTEAELRRDQFIAGNFLFYRELKRPFQELKTNKRGSGN